MSIGYAKYAGRYLAQHVTPKGERPKERTLHNCEGHVESTLLPFHGRNLAHITETDVRAWWLDRLDMKPPRHTTSSQAYVLMRSIFDQAVKDKIIATNPVDIPGAAAKRTGKKLRMPTDLDVEEVLAACSPRFASLFLTEAHAQLRFGELIALRREHITVRHVFGADKALIPEVLIHVVEGVTRVPRKAPPFGAPKSAAGERDLPLPTFASQTMIEHLEQANLTPGDLIWPALTDRTNPLAYSAYRSVAFSVVASRGGGALDEQLNHLGFVRPSGCPPDLDVPAFAPEVCAVTVRDPSIDFPHAFVVPAVAL